MCSRRSGLTKNLLLQIGLSGCKLNSTGLTNLAVRLSGCNFKSHFMLRSDQFSKSSRAETVVTGACGSKMLAVATVPDAVKGRNTVVEHNSDGGILEEQNENH